jgi:hypothetical protein
MIVALGNVKLQLRLGELLLDQVHESLRLAEVHDRVIIAMYDPTVRRQQMSLPEHYKHPTYTAFGSLAPASSLSRGKCSD